ncbi:MAG: hypothetical protein LBT05_13995 [Planctomycetaceae bacterium]|jgi:PIN domain nuclease of toxin-antitoxin system|nr:hypothetical protein [Planctomycetaceae bacterium]
MSKKYVLDACAILALLKNESGAEIVDTLLVEAAQNKCSVSMNKYALFANEIAIFIGQNSHVISE